MCIRQWSGITIGSGNGLRPTRRQAIAWTNDDLTINSVLWEQTSRPCSQNTIFISKNAFESVVCKMAAILSGHRCLLVLYWFGGQHYLNTYSDIKNNVSVSVCMIKFLLWLRHHQSTIHFNAKCFKLLSKSISFANNMMTSSNGNIFRVTGPLCGEFTGHRWIPLTKASDAELWYFLWPAPEQTIE